MIRLLWKSLRRHVQESRTLFVLTILGVALGVASVVAIQTLNQGSMQAFDGSVRAISGQAKLSVMGMTPAFPETLLVPVLGDPDVTGAWPLCRVEVAVQDRPGVLLDIAGIDLLAPLDLPFTAREDTATATLDALSALVTPGWVAITPAMAGEQGWQVGDLIAVSSGSRSVNLTVGALVDFQAFEPLAPRTLAVMDIAQVQAQLARPGLIHQIDVQLRESADPDMVARRLAARLGPAVQVVTPEQRNQDAQGLLAAFRLNLTALSMISVFVGVFLVLTTVQASLSRRRGEFGLLRCLGAGPRQVVGLILAETAVLGLLGVLIGIPLGFWVAARNVATVSATLTNIYVLAGIEKLVLTPQVILLGVSVGVLGAVAGALWPALEMARRDTVALLAPVNLHEQTGRAVGRLSWAALLLGVAATGWFVLFGSGTNWGGFVFGGMMMLALPLIVPMVVHLVAGSVRPRGLGLALSLRNLDVRLHTSSFAVAALAVTVSMLVGITLLVGSFRTTLISWLDVTMRADVYITTESWVRAGNEAFLDAGLVAEFKQWPGVDAVEEQRRLQVRTVPEGRRIWLNAIRVAGIPGAELAQRLPLQSGRPEIVAKAMERGALLIGEPLARKGGLAIGDTLQLAGPEGPVSFPVAGVVYDYTSEGGTAFVTMATLLRHFPGEQTNNAALFLENSDQAEALVSRLRQHYAGQPLVFRSNRDLRREVLAIFDQTFAVTRTLQSLALLIAMLGVALNLLVQARERSGELALLRSLGAARKQVFRLFLGEGLAIGLLGLLMGLAGGVGLAALLILVVNRTWFGWTIRPSLPVADLAAQVGLVLLASALAAVYPAAQAGLSRPDQLTRDDI
nr:FtsX-like permease family protein [Candidatus Krumholzibacteria bacterium]